MSGPPILEGPSLPPANGVPRQLVLLFHGYGASGSDLIPLAAAWRETLPEALFLAPDAPDEAPGYPMGRQWFPVAQLSLQEIDSGLVAIAPTIRRYVEAELDRYGLTPRDLALVGFSQGAMIALDIGLGWPEPIGGIISYSGVLVRPPKPRAEGYPPVLLGHGADDSLIPSAALASAEAALKQAGIAAEAMHEVGLGHGINEAEVQRGSRFLAEALSPVDAAGAAR